METLRRVGARLFVIGAIVSACFWVIYRGTARSFDMSLLWETRCRSVGSFALLNMMSCLLSNRFVAVDWLGSAAVRDPLTSFVASS